MSLVRLLTLGCFTLGTVLAQRVGAPTDDLDKLSVDELFSLEVTSVGRKAQQLSKAPAAVFVLTAEDIKRSGATSIPEALRWVPGLTVNRVDGRTWAISARGSARLYADKILVMIDGRSLYTPLFSGVIWDSIDVPLDDVERIEVVRGPGAVMWGPNAVNGVINIISKRSKATKGALLSAATGNELRGAAGARWGAAPSDKIAYRAWGKLDYRMPAYSSPGYYTFGPSTYREPVINNLDEGSGRLGFRVDAQPGEKDQLILQGDLYKIDRQDPDVFPLVAPAVDRVKGHTDYQGGYIQARWIHTASAGNESVLQFSYDHNGVNYPYVYGQLHNLTFDYQRRLQTGERNEIYWSAGYQQYWDETYSLRYAFFDPPTSIYRTGDIVLRDEWQFLRSKLLASVGVRVDYNSYSHLEYQPSFRLLFTPDLRQSGWIALSRAVRTPSRLDRDLRSTGAGSRYDDSGFLQMEFPLSGSRSMRSEKERSVEVGYRRQSGQRWSVDASIFCSYYGELRAVETSALPHVSFPAGIPVLVFPLTIDNAGTGRACGGEIWATVRALSSWRLAPSYSYVKDDQWLPSAQGLLYNWEHRPPDLRHQALLRSQHDLPHHLQFDLLARVRSRDSTYGLPGTFLMDARLGWRPARWGELSLAAQNLTNRHVLESVSEDVTPAIPLRRTLVLRWTQRF